VIEQATSVVPDEELEYSWNAVIVEETVLECDQWQTAAEELTCELKTLSVCNS
jgi:hypothetical protein